MTIALSIECCSGADHRQGARRHRSARLLARAGLTDGKIGYAYLRADLGAVQNDRESRRDSEAPSFAESEQYD
jgi:hypothetical protein